MSKRVSNKKGRRGRSPKRNNKISNRPLTPKKWQIDQFEKPIIHW